MDPFNTTKVISPATYLIAGVALLLAGAIIGVFTDPYLPASLSNAKKEYQTGYQIGFTAARTLVENSSLGAIFKTPDDFRALVGTVTSIGEGNLTLHIPSGNPFADPALADRTVVFDTSTKIVNRIEKEPSMYQISVATSTKVTQVATTSPKIFPVEYVSIPASISDIKVGDTITVIASENIKTLKEFTASEIQIVLKTPTL